MSDLKNIGIGVFLIGIAFGVPSILVRLDIVFSDVVQLIMQMGIVTTGLYFIAGDSY